MSSKAQSPLGGIGALAAALEHIHSVQRGGMDLVNRVDVHMLHCLSYLVDIR